MTLHDIDPKITIKVRSWLWKFMPGTTGAFVLYNTIHVRHPIHPRLTEFTTPYFAALLAHEYCHVLQYRRYPVTFLFRYFGGIFAGAIRGMWSKAKQTEWWNVPFEFLNQIPRAGRYFRRAYLQHPFEVEARAFEKNPTHLVPWVLLLSSSSQIVEF